MNLVGYDAMAVGNHEFDFGLARLEKSRGRPGFPWLSANVTDAVGRRAVTAVRRSRDGRRPRRGSRLRDAGTSRTGRAHALVAGLRFGDTVVAAAPSSFRSSAARNAATSSSS